MASKKDKKDKKGKEDKKGKKGATSASAPPSPAPAAPSTPSKSKKDKKDKKGKGSVAPPASPAPAEVPPLAPSSSQSNISGDSSSHSVGGSAPPPPASSSSSTPSTPLPSPHSSSSLSSAAPPPSSSSGTPASSSGANSNSPNAVLRHVNALPHRANLSDVTLVVAGGKTLHAHQNILQIRAPKLASFLDSGKKNAKKIFFKPQTIDLLKATKQNISLETMTVVLQFIYGDNLDLPSLSPTLVLHTCVAARALELPRLVRLCHDHLRAVINMQNVFPLFALSYHPETREETVYSYCMNFAHQHIKEFVAQRTEVASLGMPLFQDIVAAALEEFKPLPVDDSPVPSSTLISDFRRLFEDTIQGGSGQPDGFVMITGSKIQFHKAILAAHSDGFAALAPNQKEEDCTPLLVSNTDISADAFTAMLRYVYYGESGLSPIVGCNLAPYCAKFKLQALQNICEMNIASNIDSNNVLSVLRVAYLPENESREDMRQLRTNGVLYVRDHLKQVDLGGLVEMPRVAVDILLSWKSIL